MDVFSVQRQLTWQLKCWISFPQTNFDSQNFSWIQKVFLLYCHPASPLFKSVKASVSCSVTHLLTGCLLLPLYNSYPTFQIVLYHKNEEEGSGNWDSRVHTLLIRVTKLAENIKIYFKMHAIFMQITMQLQKCMYNTHNICADIICSRCWEKVWICIWIVS